jgi:di/tricarboxylate transporter
MNPAIASLLALLLAILLSMFSRINVGLVAIALAWIVGTWFAGFKSEAIVAGFPGPLFLTLAGVTMLFACAETNGTLKRLAETAVRLTGGRRLLLPILFFIIACVISSIGPGAISSVALVAPLAMAIGDRAGVPRLLTSLMVANGANAGNLSPISAVGVIANTKMAEAGVTGHEGKVWFTNFIAHSAVALVAYFAFGGLQGRGEKECTVTAELHEPLTRGQVLTLLIVLAWIAGVLFLKLNLGLSAFAAAALIVALRTTNEVQAVKGVPWNVIIMVCGVSLLVALLEKTGGMEHFTGLLARFSSAATVNGVIAFITGVISTYSSTSGVVLPAFLPTASKLAQQTGGDPLAIALSINVGSSIVDVSPLSTLGALCLATVKDESQSKILFRQLLLWGLSMTIAGALFSWLLAGAISRA